MCENYEWFKKYQEVLQHLGNTTTTRKWLEFGYSWCESTSWMISTPFNMDYNYEG